jgi:hypothetical protein
MNLRIRDYIQKEIGVLDYCVFAAVTLFCFLSFQHGDFTGLIKNAAVMLNGHIFDMYDIAVHPYPPSNYIIYTIWALPLKILGLFSDAIVSSLSVPLLMYFKLLTTVFYMASGYMIYKIGLVAGLDATKAKLAGILFLTMPVGFFSQFIFGQIDIFNVFFMMCGLYYYYKNDMLRFSLFFGVAITFKYFPLLYFLALLFLKEKRIPKIAWYIFLAAIPFLIECALYIHSDGFRKEVLGFNEPGFFLNMRISLGALSWSLQIAPFVVVLIYAFAYFKQTNSFRDFVAWSLFLCNAVAFASHGLVVFLPQWLLICVPFLCLSTCINKNYKTFLSLDLLMMVFFVLLVVNTFVNNVDGALFRLGIFKDITASKTMPLMKDILPFKDTSLIYTLFSALLLIHVVFKRPKHCFEDFSLPINEEDGGGGGILRTRFLAGVSFFVVPAFICLIMGSSSPDMINDISNVDKKYISPLTSGTSFSQMVKAHGTEITEVDVFVGNYHNRENTSKIEFSVIDNETQGLLYTVALDTSDMKKDNSFYKIKTPHLEINREMFYEFRFTSIDGTAGDCIAIATSGKGKTTNDCYAMINGERQDFNLDMKIYGKK